MAKYSMKQKVTSLALTSLLLFWIAIFVESTRWIIRLFFDNKFISSKEEIDSRTISMRLFVHLFFTILLSFAMEYIARYEHQYLWHCKYLWYFHSSHHHQVAEFGAGPSKDDAERNKFVSTSSFELNDIFPVIFASTSIVVLYWTFNHTHPTLVHDIAFGCACGVSVYGTSYFIGHDLCAHERGGAKLASWLRQKVPYMALCAETHMKYHHKVNVDADNDVDPYGPPYGFWLGPKEVQNYYREQKDKYKNTLSS